MLFGKKIKGSVYLDLGKDQLYNSWEGEQKDCAYDFEIITNGDRYNLVYQDGKYLGRPLHNGGAIYPFSVDPSKKGSRSDKKQFRKVKVVTIASALNLKMYWGVSDYLMFDENKTPYDIGASGVFSLELDPGDAGMAASRFYQRLCSTEASMTATELREKLLEGFQNVIGAKLEEAISEIDRPLPALIGLTAQECLQISNAVYYKVRDLFKDFGLTVVESYSVNSMVNKLIIREHR